MLILSDFTNTSLSNLFIRKRERESREKKRKKKKKKTQNTDIITVEYNHV